MISAKCYKYKKDVLLIDVVIDDELQNIDLMEFSVPEENESEDYWQVPYMEQYLKVDSDEKICETYDEPEDDVCPVRICFFLFKSTGKLLKTPYGDIRLDVPEKLPKSLKSVLDFEDAD